MLLHHGAVWWLHGRPLTDPLQAAANFLDRGESKENILLDDLMNRALYTIDDIRIWGGGIWNTPWVS